MGNVFDGDGKLLVQFFVDGLGLKETLRRTLKSKVARQFNKVLTKVFRRVRI